MVSCYEQLKILGPSVSLHTRNEHTRLDVSDKNISVQNIKHSVPLELLSPPPTQVLPSPCPSQSVLHHGLAAFFLSAFYFNTAIPLHTNTQKVLKMYWRNTAEKRDAWNTYLSTLPMKTLPSLRCVSWLAAFPFSYKFKGSLPTPKISANPLPMATCFLIQWLASDGHWVHGVADEFMYSIWGLEQSFVEQSSTV